MLERIRGRLLYARALFVGRFAGLAVRNLNLAVTCLTRSSRHRLPHDLVHDLRHSLGLLARTISTAPARSIQVAHHSPALLFTDGAYEPAAGLHRGTIGGVLLDKISGDYRFYAAYLDEHTLNALEAKSKTQKGRLNYWQSLRAWYYGGGCLIRGRSLPS